MPNFTTTNSTAPPPSTTAHHHTSPIAAVLGLVAIIAIPMISYTFFTAIIRCPRNPFRRSAAAATAEESRKREKIDLGGGVKSAAESNDECPVCLSALSEGEEIRQLSACKHAFHGTCVDTWLSSHSSCPVCRAAVPVKRPKRVWVDPEDDFRQGLPDAATLI